MKLTPAQRRAFDERTDNCRKTNTVTAAPSTIDSLRRLGLVGRTTERFALKEQAPHGRWFNRQFVTAELTPEGQKLDAYA